MPSNNLSWLADGDPFPAPELAWGRITDAPGLLAVGASLDIPTLLDAYSNGIFPWFSQGQPTLWWSPDPRMVLRLKNFRLHRSLRKTIRRFRTSPNCEIRVDSAFEFVINACSSSPRSGQAGTWIVPAMVKAYIDLHHAGFAHSVETWVDGKLEGGLYCVAIGKAVFGESMFARSTDASKIALSALIAICRHDAVELIDCQQNTQHLAFLGADEIDRAEFLMHTRRARHQAGPVWQFPPLYWENVLSA
ncbi:MAG: leucyl/phenylalanyl-tRNA--protein transferase [Glaciimonas sp.]|nr:leucyl/phenylalanyl-tRNA--protein transferase [Glaciimonas sp.]